MEPQQQTFESALREMLIPIIHHAVDKAMERYFIAYMEAHPAEPEILDLKSAAEFLGMAHSTIYTFTCRRQIPHFKRGRRLMFKRSELVEWVGEGRRGTKRDKRVGIQ